MSEEKQYAERDLMGVDVTGNHYCRHISAMTREQLHSKSDIAAELGWRDMQIAELKAQRDALAADRERFAVQCAAAKIAVQYARAAGFECTLNTPAVDAFLNSVRAEGVEMFADLTISIGEEEKSETVIYAGKQALLFAAQLRAREQIDEAIANEVQE